MSKTSFLHRSGRKTLLLLTMVAMVGCYAGAISKSPPQQEMNIAAFTEKYLEPIKEFSKLDAGYPVAMEMPLNVDCEELSDAANSRLEVLTMAGRVSWMLQKRLYDAMGQTLKETSLKRDEWPSALKLREIRGLVRAGDLSKAKPLCEELLKVDDKCVEVYLLLAEIEQRAQNLDLAIEILERARKAVPKHEKILESLGRRYELRMRQAKSNAEILASFKDLLDVYGDLVEAVPGRPSLPFLHLLVYITKQMKEVEKQQSYLEKLVQIDPYNTEDRLALVALLRSLGQKEQALDLLRRGIILKATDEELRTATEGMVIEESRKDGKVPAEALMEFYKDIAAEYPGREDLQVRYSLLLLLNSKPEEAITVLKDLLEIHPYSADAWFRLANIYAGMDRNEEALEALNKFMAQTGSENGSAKMKENRQMAVMLMAKIGSNETTQKALEGLLKESPENWRLHLAMAYLYQKANETEKLKAYMDEILSKFPEEFDVVYTIAMIKWEAEEMDEVEPLLKKAMVLAPLDSEPRNSLAYFYCEMNENLDEAMTLVQKALELSDKTANQSHIVDTLGWVYFKKGDYPKAIDTLEQAIKLKDSDPVMQEHLAWSYLEAGRTPDAVRHFKIAVKLLAEGDDPKKESKTREIQDKIKELDGK